MQPETLNKVSESSCLRVRTGYASAPFARHPSRQLADRRVLNVKKDSKLCRNFCSFIIAGLMFCSSSLGEQVRFEDLYGVALPEAVTILGDVRSRQLSLALEDFNAVLAGRYPKHGKFDPKAKWDHCYNGDGYIIRILNTPVVIKNGDSEVVAGCIYGPQLTLHTDSAVTWGETPAICRTRFYRPEELKQLRRRSRSEIEELRRRVEKVRENARHRIEGK